MFSKYKKFIDQYVLIDSKDWNIVESQLRLACYKKGEIIHHVGDVSTKILFINKGLARSYILDKDGRDHTWCIYFNDKNSHPSNLFIVDYESFLTKNESRLEIEAIEDVEVVVIDNKTREYLYKNTKNGETFGRKMAQEAYIYLYNQLVDRQTKSASERFQDFMKSTPYLLDKVPQYQIASFLGITPQHLSRLKKNL